MEASGTIYGGGKAGLGFVLQLLEQEIKERSELAGFVTAQLEALRGAIIYLGNIDRETAYIAGNQRALSDLCQELKGHGPERGYCIIDANSNDWVHNGTEWVNIGYYEIATATNSGKGVVKGSAANGKVSVDGAGEMAVNGFADKQDKLAAGANITISGNTISAANTVYDDQKKGGTILGYHTKAATRITNISQFSKEKSIYWLEPSASVDLATFKGFGPEDVGRVYRFELVAMVSSYNEREIFFLSVKNTKVQMRFTCYSNVTLEVASVANGVAAFSIVSAMSGITFINNFLMNVSGIPGL